MNLDAFGATLNLYPKSIVSILFELVAPWENSSQKALGQLVDLELCLEKEKALLQGIIETIANPWQDRYCVRLQLHLVQTRDWLGILKEVLENYPSRGALESSDVFLDI